ncbi:MAG: SRPBCC family protein, partial [Acidimicrobiia bacterium]
MSTNSVRTQANPEQVFAVLDDAYAYPKWVVGARRVRHVDPNWPAVGSRFHHAIGTAAGELHDSSKVLEREKPDHLALEVRFRPVGVARVDLDVRTDGTGSVVTLTERPLGGPFAWLPRIVSDPLLSARNVLALERLR